jgi:hypothetical protein
MTDRDPIWDALKKRSQGKFDADRTRFLQQAQSDDDGGWTKHTEFHWSRVINGERLDYWPSRKKFQYRGQVLRGLRAMYKIIRAAGVPLPAPRLLTGKEAAALSVEITEQHGNAPFSEWKLMQVVQRKFCEVNGLPQPAHGSGVALPAGVQQ